MSLLSNEEVSYEQLTTGRRWFLLILASIGSSIIYAPVYLKAVVYDPLLEALGVTNTQLGAVFSVYAITALICYLPSGIIADKVRMRTLSSAGFIGTAVLTGIYALMPSLGTLYALFVMMGITTILIWWGVRYKLVRLVSTEAEYPKRIGLSYGFYGAAGLLIGLVSMGVMGAVGSNTRLGVSFYLWFLAALILGLGICSLLFIPKFKGEIKTDGSGFNFSEFLAAFRNPVVWIAAASLFFVYFFYTGVTYTTPYLTQVLGASAVVTILIANIRTFGITLLSGPAFGFISEKFKPSRTIMAGSLAFVVLVLALLVLPTSASVVVIAMLVIILLGFIANGSFSVVSAQLTEGKVPLHYFGAATGLLSVIGFLPDTFLSIWFGRIMDANPNPAHEGWATAAAYNQMFVILIVAAVLAAAFSALLFLYLKSKKADTVDEAPLEAVAETAESVTETAEVVAEAVEAVGELTN